MNTTNPGTIFGGTWEQLQGRFLLGCGALTDPNGEFRFYNPNETGGEYSHKLNLNELPSHYHGGINVTGIPLNANGVAGSGAINVTLGSGSIPGSNNIYTSSSGGDQYHNNMPPFITCFMWKRTA